MPSLARSRRRPHCDALEMELPALLISFLFFVPNLAVCGDAGVVQESLFLLYQQSYYGNPLLGVGTPPQEGYLPAYAGVPNATAKVQFIVEELTIDARRSTFNMRYYWHLTYNDSRFFNLYWENNATDCEVPCSTLPNVIVNKYGGDACCQGNYNPNAHFLNLKGTALSALPQEWYWYGEPDSDKVEYYFRARSTFNSNFNFQAFPFERQKLQLLISADFLPQLPDNCLVLTASSRGLPIASVSTSFPGADPRRFPVAGWSVMQTSCNLVSLKTQLNRLGRRNIGPEDGPINRKPGIRLSIVLARNSMGFFVQLFILPPALEILMVFASYCYDPQNIKNRMELLSIMFLALLFVQFFVRWFLPSQMILPPYVVCLVSFVYVFAFAASYLVIKFICHAYETTSRRKHQLSARLDFEYFQRKQLKQCLHTVDFRAKDEGWTVDLDNKHVSRLLVRNAKTIDRLEGDIKSLYGPWYLRHRSPLLLLLLQKSSLVRKVDRWHYCFTRSSSQKYCQEIAEYTERILCVAMFVSYYTAVTLVYAAQDRLGAIVGPV